jgi:hypothetical protein
MNVKKLVTILACAAWAGAAISFATPASAVAITSQYGQFATCSNYWTYSPQVQCNYYLNYQQTMRFQTSACSGGTCTAQYGGTYVENVYVVGRKTATVIFTGCSFGTVYGIDDCGC